MAALFFPHQSALRLALANGLVPAEMSRAPVMAGFDSHGRLWLELAELPPRESLASLARVGVQVLSGSNVRTEQARCWAELLSLVRMFDGIVNASFHAADKLLRAQQGAEGNCSASE